MLACFKRLGVPETRGNGAFRRTSHDFGSVDVTDLNYHRILLHINLLDDSVEDDGRYFNPGIERKRIRLAMADPRIRDTNGNEDTRLHWCEKYVDSWRGLYTGRCGRRGPCQVSGTGSARVTTVVAILWTTATRRPGLRLHRTAVVIVG